MCGIIGYIGTRAAYRILISDLHRLEYCGYDSAGVALLGDSQQISVYKAKGKVSALEEAACDKDCIGTIGIAQTRWATHGETSVVNAHPHLSESGNLALVHNDIIENFSVLRDQLMAKAAIEREQARPHSTSGRLLPLGRKKVKCLEDCMRGRLEAMDKRLKIEPENQRYGINLSAVNLSGDRLLRARRFRHICICTDKPSAR